jgi:hypothetical protein
MALAAGIPVYDEMVDAAQALRAVRSIEQQWSRAASRDATAPCTNGEGNGR